MNSSTYVYKSNDNTSCEAWFGNSLRVSQKEPAHKNIIPGEKVELLSRWTQSESEFTSLGIVKYEVDYAKVRLAETGDIFIVRWAEWDGETGWERV